MVLLSHVVFQHIPILELFAAVNARQAEKIAIKHYNITTESKRHLPQTKQINKSVSYFKYFKEVS